MISHQLLASIVSDEALAVTLIEDLLYMNYFFLPSKFSYFSVVNYAISRC